MKIFKKAAIIIGNVLSIIFNNHVKIIFNEIGNAINTANFKRALKKHGKRIQLGGAEILLNN